MSVCPIPKRPCADSMPCSLMQIGLRKEGTPGSFVRPNRPADPSRGFVEALRQKYACLSASGAATTTSLQQEEQSIRISGKEVEEVGFDKVRKQLANLHELRIVILDGLCIARPLSRNLSAAGGDSGAPLDSADDIRRTCPRIAELDLSRNLFEEWREILSICQQLETLNSLKIEYAIPSRFTTSDKLSQRLLY